MHPCALCCQWIRIGCVWLRECVYGCRDRMCNVYVCVCVVTAGTKQATTFRPTNRPKSNGCWEAHNRHYAIARSHITSNDQMRKFYRWERTCFCVAVCFNIFFTCYVHFEPDDFRCNFQRGILENDWMKRHISRSEWIFISMNLTVKWTSARFGLLVIWMCILSTWDLICGSLKFAQNFKNLNNWIGSKWKKKIDVRLLSERKRKKAQTVEKLSSLSDKIRKHFESK